MPYFEPHYSSEVRYFAFIKSHTYKNIKFESGSTQMYHAVEDMNLVRQKF